MYLVLARWLRALMQLPRASSERLMWAPSFILCPRFCVWAGRGRQREKPGKRGDRGGFRALQPPRWVPYLCCPLRACQVDHKEAAVAQPPAPVPPAHGDLQHRVGA